MSQSASIFCGKLWAGVRSSCLLAAKKPFIAEFAEKTRGGRREESDPTCVSWALPVGARTPPLPALSLPKGQPPRTAALRVREENPRRTRRKPRSKARLISAGLLLAQSSNNFSVAARQLEVGDARIPVDCRAGLIGLVVLVFVPEGAAIRRIYGHAGDVAPVR